jgi:hypothetical protein
MALSSVSKTGSIKVSSASVASAGFGPNTNNYGLTATGGTITEFTYGGNTYRAHTFTSSSAFVVSALGSLYNNIELLVVGSGTGGITASNGGAGGQVVYYGAENSNYFSRVVGIAGSELSGIQVGTYTVTIGAGGANYASTPGNVTSASSSFSGTNISVTATGGSIKYSSQSKTYTVSGNGIQSGNAGSNSTGIGGAGASGSGAVQSAFYDVGPGGPGMYFSITGKAGFYGGGGALGINSGYGANMARSRGEGGGFCGGRSDEAGVTNTGGGGGSGWNGSASKGGGSGVVVVKYRIR